MQVEQLPCWEHRELDRSIRKCVWENAKGRRGCIYRIGTLCASLRARWCKLEISEGHEPCANGQASMEAFEPVWASMEQVAELKVRSGG